MLALVENQPLMFRLLFLTQHQRRVPLLHLTSNLWALLPKPRMFILFDHIPTMNPMAINLSTPSIFVALLCAFTVAQFPPAPENVTTIKSRFNDKITISYKEVCAVDLLPLRSPWVGFLTLFSLSLVYVRLHPESDHTQGTLPFPLAQ